MTLWGLALAGGAIGVVLLWQFLAYADGWNRSGSAHWSRSNAVTWWFYKAGRKHGDARRVKTGQAKESRTAKQARRMREVGDL